MDKQTNKTLTTKRYKQEMQEIIVAMIRVLLRALRKIDDAEYNKTLNELKKLNI